MNLKRKQIILAYLFLTPAFIFLIVFVFFPVISGLILSLFTYNFFSSPVFIGVDNFKEAFRDETFLLALKNALIYLLIVPPIQILSILLATLLDRNIKGVKIFRTAYFIPVVTSLVSVAITWKWIFNSDGIINLLLKNTGIINNSIGFLTNPNLALFSVMFVTLWKGLGYYMIIYLAGLQSIPNNLYEAAKIDGASGRKIWFYITLPLLKPSILLCSILSAMAAIRVFDEIFVMTEGGPMNSSMVPSLYIYETVFGDYRFGYGAALSVVLAILVGIFTVINFKLFGGKGAER